MACSGQYLGGCCEPVSPCAEGQIATTAMVQVEASSDGIDLELTRRIYALCAQILAAEALTTGNRLFLVDQSLGVTGPFALNFYGMRSGADSWGGCGRGLGVYHYAGFLGISRTFRVNVAKARISSVSAMCYKEATNLTALPGAQGGLYYPAISGVYFPVGGGIYDVIPAGSPAWGNNKIVTGIGGISFIPRPASGVCP